MRLRNLAFVAGATGAAMAAYGHLVEARRLVVEKRTLALPRWPERLRDFKIAVLSDLHVRNAWTSQLAADAIALALDEEPDMVVLPGDLVDSWHYETPKQIGDLLEPLLLMDGSVVAIPGNHDYIDSETDLLQMILNELNIRFLRNESWRHLGITWVGIDSASAYQADVVKAFHGVHSDPVIALWHEPDLVRRLPRGVALQISGHGHGRQFVFPGGFAPMHTKFGKRYSGGWYPDAPTPLYVSRGIGTTLLPIRFNCPPEVSILKLVPGDLPTEVKLHEKHA
ncbi:MAG TPA: metallophosphoesterase [Fimbriimonas sp.]